MPVFDDPLLVNRWIEIQGYAGPPSAAPSGKALLYYDLTTGTLRLAIAGGATAEVPTLLAGSLSAADLLSACAANSIAGSLLAANTIQYAAVEVSSAQIKALFTTPVSLVAAQGANTIIQFCGALIAYDYGTTAYTINGSDTLAVQYTNGSGATASTTRATTGFIDQTADKLEIMAPVATAVVPVANAALVLTCATANPTVGDGVLHVKVAYRVLATGL